MHRRSEIHLRNVIVTLSLNKQTCSNERRRKIYDHESSKNKSTLKAVIKYLHEHKNDHNDYTRHSNSVPYRTHSHTVCTLLPNLWAHIIIWFRAEASFNSRRTLRIGNSLTVRHFVCWFPFHHINWVSLITVSQPNFLVHNKCERISKHIKELTHK